MITKLIALSYRHDVVTLVYHLFEVYITMEKYYSRILKQDKSLDRVAILHGDIETLLLKLDTVQRQCFQPEIISEVKKHVNLPSLLQSKSFSVYISSASYEAILS